MTRKYIVLNKMFTLKILTVLLFLLNLFPCRLRAQKDTITTFNYIINSQPYNAEVYYSDTLAGLTPLRFTSEKKLTGVIIIRKEHYKQKVFDMSSYDFNKGAEIILEPLKIFNQSSVIIKTDTYFKNKRNVPAVMFSGAMTFAGGYLALNFKNKANDFYNNYMVNRNTGDLDKSRKYDTYSVISLILMQTAIAGLVYFLFIEK
ncbi:hypothetical protein D4R20_02285 [bacterium]|nr:MAG: hypothetical protein D4R20_02285 [bacterium]